MARSSTVRLYALHSLFSRLYFFLPILVLWFLAQGFSQFQVTLLLSLFFLSATLCEIPTGLFSDRFGHRWGIALCGVFQALGVLCLAFASHFGLAIVGEILMGLGQAFYTGAKEAYLFNFLETQQESHLYQRDYAQAKFFEFIGMALGSLVGGSIYDFSPQLPFYLTAAAFFLASGMTYFLKEIPHAGEQAPMDFKGFQRGFREIWQGSTALKSLVGYYCLFFTVILLFIVVLVQPYLRKIGLPVVLFGITFFFFQISSMLGSLLAKKIPMGRLDRSFFLFLAVSFTGIMLGLSLHHSLLSIPLVVAIYLIWGIFLPTSSEVVNRLIRSDSRATVLSTQDFLQSFLFVLTAPLVGIVVDSWGIGVGLFLLSLLMGGASLIARKIVL